MSNEDQPLVGKKYLLMLPVLLVFAAWNVFFNPECRKLLGLKPGKTISISSWFNFSPAVKKSSSKPLAKLSFSADEVGTFTASFTNEQIEVVVITPREAICPKCGLAMSKCKCEVVPEVCPKCGKPIDECLCDKFEKDVPWLVPVQGTFADTKGRWNAIISGQYCRAGKQIVSARQERCAYSILSVGRRCVWMQAYPRVEASPPPLPEITWPDVSMIALERRGVINHRYVPAKIVFANGATARKGDTLEYRQMQTRFTVKELWQSGVVFEAMKGDERALISCMLISR